MAARMPAIPAPTTANRKGVRATSLIGGPRISHRRDDSAIHAPARADAPLPAPEHRLTLREERARPFLRVLRRHHRHAVLLLDRERVRFGHGLRLTQERDDRLLRRAVRFFAIRAAISFAFASAWPSGTTWLIRGGDADRTAAASSSGGASDGGTMV